LLVSSLVSDELYNKLNRLLGIWIGVLKVIALVVFKTRLGLEVKGVSFDMSR